MTDKSKEVNQPTIEEILASIRVIISKDIDKNQKLESEPYHGSDDYNSKHEFFNKAASVSSDNEVTNEIKVHKNLEKEEMDSIVVNDLAKELMRPIIKEWLEKNLLGIVERVVEVEVERLARLSEKKG